MLANTHEFSRAGKHFLEHGFYCGDPQGSAAYFEYWAEELRRCIEGYSVGDVSITGHHYFYLNYVQIKLTDKGNKKIVSFPNFWDGDYEYFWLQEIARNGIDPVDYERLNLSTFVDKTHMDGSRHLIVGKARRKGFSYKNAALVTNTFNTERNSYTLLCAFDKKYLYPKGIMAMVTDNMNFLNEHTGWAKRRQVVDKQNHRRASYLEYMSGQQVEKGYKSEVEAITFKDNPDAARGKDASIVIFEECGAFDNLKASYLATKPTVEDGGITTGQMILFGTGGDMAGGTIDFESMFYNPEAYNLLPITNIWDEGADHTTCGYFFPAFKNKIGHMDVNGNSDMVGARQSEDAKREQIKRDSKDAGVLDKHITEYPFTPKEAFLQHTSNIFPTATLLEWRNELMRSGMFKSLAVAGHLIQSKDGVKLKPDDRLRPVLKFPVQRGDDTTGCVVMYQSPYKENGEVPRDLYIIAHDPYAQDGRGQSLGAAYVIKRVNALSQPDDMIVASYIGRPDTQDEYNNTLFLLAKYYNARIGFENDRGEVIPFAKRHKLMQHLLPEVEIFDKTDNVRIRKLGRSYGMSMGSKERKGQAEIYLRDWLKTPRGRNESGEVRLNLHQIYDIALIDELVKYNRRGNFDRVSALMVGMFHLKDLHTREVKVVEQQSENTFFDRAFFS
tara:strand:+ start:1178 stop:3187 length:2010 start_codon:yes stop_codon:yes gene_type:complete